MTGPGETHTFVNRQCQLASIIIKACQKNANDTYRRELDWISLFIFKQTKNIPSVSPITAEQISQFPNIN